MTGSRTRSLIFCASVYVACSAVATIAFRQWAAPDMIVEDREALWRLQPGFVGAPRSLGEGEGEGTPLTVASIDARGFRTLPREPVVAQAEPIKILAVGDSY